jgi:hypothetical protein
MPLGVMPTMFNVSEVRAVPYAEGGYTLSIPWSDMLSRETPAAQGGKKRPVDLWREGVPLPLRKQVPPAVLGRLGARHPR